MIFVKRALREVKIFKAEKTDGRTTTGKILKFLEKSKQ
jgi:hypothetical protein